jgi:hypothetical protein
MPGCIADEPRDREVEASCRLQLTGDDLAEIEGAASAITVQGARYPEWLEATTGR